MKEDGKEINETETGRYANYIDRGQMVVREVNWRRWQFALVRSEAESRVSCVICGFESGNICSLTVLCSSYTIKKKHFKIK